MESQRSQKLRLTVVVANYNYAHYLPVAIDAIVKQSRPPDELIIINDASTDGSQSVIEDFAASYPFIKTVTHNVNRGVLASIQEAVEMATGDYIYFGAADDMVLPGFFESSMSLLEKFPGAPICAGIPMHWHEDSDRQFSSCVGMPPDSGFLQPRELWPLLRRGALGLGGLSTILKLAELKAIGGFPPSLKWHVDFFVANSLALGSGLVWTAKPAAMFRVHTASYSNLRLHRRREERHVLAELARVISDEMPKEVQNGFRASGILGRLGWLMASTLLAKRAYRGQLSTSFWIVCLTTIKHRISLAIARTVLPTSVRRAITRKVRSETEFDLSAMKVAKKP